MNDKNLYEMYEDIIKNKISIPEFAKKNDTTKQNINVKVKNFLTSIVESEKYKKAFSIDNEKNIIKKVHNNLPEEDGYLFDIFKYINKKNIFILKDMVFYSSIDTNTLNTLLRDTLTDLKRMDIRKALLANNIEADNEFIEIYAQNIDLKVRPLDILEGLLKEHNKPMIKEDLIQAAASLGVKEKTAINIIRNVSNNEDKIIILGDTVCDREVFFNTYIDAKIAHEFLIAAVAVCDKNMICATDIKWIKTNVESAYPNIDISKYTYYELKAILCNDPELFEKGVKFNVKYLSNQCQFVPNNTTELVEKVLNDYKLPVTFSFISMKLKEHGKSFSNTTLTSHILPSVDKFEKIRNAGWVLKENAEYANKLIEEAESIEITEIINQLKKQFAVVTLKDLATKTGLNLSTLSDAYYKTIPLETFITKLNEFGYQITIKNGIFKIVK